MLIKRKYEREKNMKCCSRVREKRTVMVQTGNKLVDLKVA
jgi:hypothetical protein